MPKKTIDDLGDIKGKPTYFFTKASELDPKYVDVAIRRWQAWTGETARLAATGQTFAEVAADRIGQPLASV